MHDAVDEERRCALHLAGGQAAVHVPANARKDVGAGPVAVELCEVQRQLLGVAPQVVVLEHLLASEEQLVHLPEPLLARGRLGCGGCGERVGVDLGQREVPEAEAQAALQSALDTLDVTKRLARVRAFVVAVLDDHAAGRGTANVVDRVVKRLHRLLPVSLAACNQ